MTEGSTEVDDEVVRLMQSWTNRPRDFWRVEEDKVIREHVVPRAQSFCVRWTGCPVDGAELYDDRTTVMYFADGHKEEVKDKI